MKILLIIVLALLVVTEYAIFQQHTKRTSSRSGCTESGKRKEQTMSDLIKREDAIKAMEQRYEDILRTFKRKVKIGEKAIVLDMIGCVKNLPSADRPQGEWIPCSERLPKEGEIVLVCMGLTGHKYEWEEQRIIEFGRISSDRYDAEGTGWEWLNESGADYWEPDYGNSIVAWMPLPEPWKGADDE